MWTLLYKYCYAGSVYTDPYLVKNGSLFRLHFPFHDQWLLSYHMPNWIEPFCEDKLWCSFPSVSSDFLLMLQKHEDDKGLKIVQNKGKGALLCIIQDRLNPLLYWNPGLASRDRKSLCTQNNWSRQRCHIILTVDKNKKEEKTAWFQRNFQVNAEISCLFTLLWVKPTEARWPTVHTYLVGWSMCKKCFSHSLKGIIDL